MLAHRDRMLDELIRWLSAHAIEPTGPFFLRLNVVNMSGLMDIEVGVAGPASNADDRVRAGTLPAGDYAILAYRATSLAANRLLLRWVHEQGLVLDSQHLPAGEAFVCRCERYLTDPRTERRKKTWVIELAFLTTLT